MQKHHATDVTFSETLSDTSRSGDPRTALPRDLCRGVTATPFQHIGSGLGKPFSALCWSVTLAWAVLIFYLSSQTYGPGFSRGLLVWALQVFHLRLASYTFNVLHAGFRTLAHLIEYGIFALLLYCLPDEKSASLWQPQRALFCIFVAAGYSLTDEFHQFFVPGRHASLLDCGLDTVGAALAMLVPYMSAALTRKRRD